MQYMVLKLLDSRGLDPVFSNEAAHPDEMGFAQMAVPAGAIGRRGAAQVEIPETIGVKLPMKDRPTVMYVSEDAALTEAKKLAKKNPGTAYVVYQPLVVFEATQPQEPEIVVKEYNPAGELVVMK